MTNNLNPIIAQHIAAVNAFDTDAIVSTFADDAFVNDNHREFRGIDAIRRSASVGAVTQTTLERSPGSGTNTQGPCGV